MAEWTPWQSPKWPQSLFSLFRESCFPDLVSSLLMLRTCLQPTPSSKKLLCCCKSTSLCTQEGGVAPDINPSPNLLLRRKWLGGDQASPSSLRMGLLWVTVLPCHRPWDSQ